VFWFFFVHFVAFVVQINAADNVNLSFL